MLNVALMLQNNPDPAQIQHMILAFIWIIPFIVLFFLALYILPFWFICKKAGFSPFLSLLIMVPLGNLILIYILAFADWKVIPAPQALWQPPMQSPMAPPPSFPPQS